MSDIGQVVLVRAFWEIDQEFRDYVKLLDRDPLKCAEELLRRIKV